MKLPELCIKKPVLATVLSLILIVLGLVAFKRLEIRFFPEVKLPVVNVYAGFSGADASLMETQVTKPLENAIASIDGVKYISSSSYSGGSHITVMFRMGGDFEAEASQVRDKVAAEQKNLPSDMSAPSVSVGGNQGVVINYGITATGKTSAEIRNYVTHTVVPMLTQLKGVGSVGVNGAWDYALRVWLNASKMAALGVSVDDVQNAINHNNIYFPAGSFHGQARNYSVITNTQLTNPEQFANIIVRSDSNGTIRLKDIATVKQGYTTPFPTPLYLNGKQGVVLNISPLGDANPIDVANEVKAEMTVIRANFPEGMQAKIIYDKSIFLKSSIDETFKTIAEAVILVILVVLAFLGSMRAAIIPIVTIPVSLIAVFFVIYSLGFSINSMSLLGIVLAIGLVVDDAIVMLENIHRHMEHGVSAISAALKGSKEIMSAVIAMSITLAAVYAPIGFAQGFTAVLFQQFAFTLAGSVVISGFVALTLSPMMCSKILVPVTKQNGYSAWLDKTFERIDSGYKALLTKAIQKRHTILVFLLVIAGVGVFLFGMISSEFLPKDDYGLIEMSVSAPAGATAAYVSRYLNDIETIVKHEPAIESFGYQLLNGGMLSFFTLKPWQQRTESVQQLVNRLNPELARIPGLTVTTSVPSVINFSDGSGLQIDLMTTGNYRDLLGPINKLETILKNYPGVFNVNTNLKFNSQQYALTINRDLAAAAGVSLQDIADTVHAMMSGQHWTNIESSNAAYDVLVQMRKQDMLGFGGLDHLYVPSAHADSSGATPGMIPLSSLITLKPIVGQGSLIHYDRMRAAEVTASISPGFTMSNVVNYVQSHIEKALDSKTQYAFVGAAEQFLDSSGNIIQIFLLAFVFIYLVLAAQFGSFIDPFIILFAVPLSIVGALCFLLMANGTLNLYSEIGLVTLVGMISKHGILITQFINDLRADGMSLKNAIIEGAAVRLRPILMTTAAMVFGALPLALAYGPGSVGRSQIGWVIVGGLLCGTFFSLFVVPIAYYYLGRFKKFEQQDS